MLEFFRSHVKDSIFFKIFLGLLALSFGIWGVGDSIGTSSLSPGVAMRAGQSEIRIDFLQRRFNNELERFRQAMGARVLTDDMMKRSVMSTMVQDLSRASVVDAAAMDLGLVVSREEIRDQVKKQQAFQKNGEFSQMQFEQVLQDNQLTESAFVKMTESDMRSGRLMVPVARNAAAPQVLVGNLFTYRSETRTADTLLIPAAAMALEKTPTDDELKAVYDKNIGAFTAPEVRKLTVLLLAGSDLVKPESIDEAELKTYYDQNSARYRAPATRHLAQIVFESKEKAEAARAQLQPGDTLETLAAKAKVGPAIDLGELPATSPLGKLVPAAFTAAEHEITPALESPLGWHLVEVKSVTPEAVKSFEQVKDDIRKTIAADKGADAVYDASTHMEDALASGSPPTEVAKTVGARLVTIESIDHEGKDKAGLTVPNLPDPKEFITTAFETPAGRDSRLMDLPTRDGYYIVHVDEVTPPTPKPLLEVRPQVAALWETAERQNQAQALADKLAKDINATTVMSDIKEKSASFAQLGPLTRFGQGLEIQHLVDAKRVSPVLLDKLFNAKVGDVVVAPVSTGVLIARLQAVETPKITGMLAAQRDQLADTLRQDIATDLTEQLTRAFAARYPVEVDQKTIDNMITGR